MIFKIRVPVFASVIIEVNADNEEDAKEKLYDELGETGLNHPHRGSVKTGEINFAMNSWEIIKN